jgi:hypothetical protein
LRYRTRGAAGDFRPSSSTENGFDIVQPPDDEDAALSHRSGEREQQTDGGLGDALRRMRSEGWTVAVHNDYRQNGQPMTFWLFTNETHGTFVKGEGPTDLAAVTDARAAALSPRPDEREQQAEQGGGTEWWAVYCEGKACAAYPREGQAKVYASGFRKPTTITKVKLAAPPRQSGDGRMTAEQAMAELWGLFCPDCGPEDYGFMVQDIGKLAPTATTKPFEDRELTLAEMLTEAEGIQQLTPHDSVENFAVSAAKHLLERQSENGMQMIVPMGNLRNQMLEWVPAEHAIHNAMQAVEAMPADVRLTEAVTLLGGARQKVAQFIIATGWSAGGKAPADSKAEPGR